ncbi:MAG TPA: phosphate signaling complex protein PhoU [Candidatus Caccoplasma intestinavium]|uniref:Phosphate-specific transport system accessory protein PhoU n=1 Tax=Candidatus Caccoplasma intestinavium TaxID=2840716 RepID=A0A9D1KCQ7_9BACT|nr:phosphate signaling complex protein PhoU [Candidatus Caccoplasma intestinavium]
MVKFVENELLAIKEEVNDMWLLVHQQLENAFNALRNNDDDLANSVASREKRVNAFELKIDSDIEDFIALYNPVAVDLRFALAMLKINNNLERIGDYADSIARFVARNNLTEEDKQLFNVLEMKEMYDQVLHMFSTTHKALENSDASLAKSVIDKDDLLDSLNQKALDKLAEYAKNNPSAIRFCLEIAAILRKLERTGDHIINLAEETVFYIDAEVLKHIHSTAPSIDEE